MPVNNKLIIPWVLAVLFLVGYYAVIQWPLQRSFIQGVELIRQQNYTEARTVFTRMIKDHPYYAPAYVNRWYLNVKEGKDEEAKADYQRMMHLHYTNGEMHTPKGLVYGKIINPDHAIDFYNQEVVRRYAIAN